MLNSSQYLGSGAERVSTQHARSSTRGPTETDTLPASPVTLQTNSAGPATVTLQSIANIYTNGRVNGTRDLGNGRRGAISGPSEAYGEGERGSEYIDIPI
jgi:peptidoglycan hydrolase-like protein with peptidoglycan-binding domain